MPRKTPLTPIFDHKRRSGAIDVGGTPGASQPVATEVAYFRDATNLYQSHDQVYDAGYIYAATYFNQTFTVIDATDPLNLSVLATVSLAPMDEPVYTSKDGDIVVVRSYADGRIAVVDVSNPAAPSVEAIIGGTGTPGNGVRVYNGGLHVMTGTASATTDIYDLSTPSSPSLLTSLGFANFRPSRPIVGTHTYTAGVSDLRAVDISTPASPSSLGAWSGEVGQIVTDGTDVYAVSTTTLYRLDESTPGSFVQTGSAPLGNSYIEMSGHYPLAAAIRNYQPVSLLPINLAGMIAGPEITLTFTASVTGFVGHTIYPGPAPYVFVANRKDCSISTVLVSA